MLPNKRSNKSSENLKDTTYYYFNKPQVELKQLKRTKEDHKFKKPNFFNSNTIEREIGHLKKSNKLKYEFINSFKDKNVEITAKKQDKGTFVNLTNLASL